MDTKIDFQSLSSDSRARVYLLWAVLTAVGYTATHYYQQKGINILWVVLVIIGLGFMSQVMPLRVSQMKKIYLAWLVPISFGIIVSGLVFYVDGIAELLGYLGGFWLIVQSAGFLWNGLVDSPSRWYFIVAAVNFIIGLACFSFDSLIAIQYLVAAIVTAWSMLMLWTFRTS